MTTTTGSTCEVIIAYLETTECPIDQGQRGCQESTTLALNCPIQNRGFVAIVQFNDKQKKLVGRTTEQVRKKSISRKNWNDVEPCW